MQQDEMVGEFSAGDNGIMIASTLPVQALLLSVSGWVHGQQQQVVEYLIEENRVLKEQLGGKRVRLTNDQRRRLAAKGKRLGRRLLHRVATIVTPDTILRWHRKLIAAKWTYRTKRVGRPGLMKHIRELIIRFALENSNWGYTRIEGALKNVGHHVSPTTIRKTLKEHGIKPAPDRPSSWRTFLRSHWGEIAATDLFTTEVWTPRGLRTYYVLFFIELKSRRVHLSPPTLNPTDWFMGTATEAALPFLERCRFMIHDRDSKYSLRFRNLMESAGIKTIRTPKLAPNANAFAERFVRTIKDECLNRMILFGEKHLQRALDEFLAHYHIERNHQGIGNDLIDGEPSSKGDIVCDERLGGLLKHYRRAA